VTHHRETTLPTTTTLIPRIRRELLKVDGVVESPGAFNDGDAFWVNGTHIAHFIDDGSMEVRLTRKQISANRARLKGDERVELRKSSSDWLIVRFAAPRDVAFVTELAEIAAAAHRAPVRTTPKAPPTGAALERRRRFH
jgi:hypothetical protein